MDKGSIHIYCGEGKGKTTAAIGQGIQEASQGRSVIIIQFMKERNAEAIGFVQRLEPEIKLFRFQKAEEAFEDLPDAEKAEEIKNLKNALNFARKVLVTEECDVLILDGIQCVARMEQKPAGTYDLILMDIQMPNMDGYKATQTIRRLADEKKASIPIIAMTANAFEEDRKKALAEGMNGHIAKPVDAEKLKKTILSALR